MFSQLNFNLHQFKAFSLNLTIEMNLFTEYITLTPSWQFETWKFFGWNTSCRGVVAWGGEQQRIYNEHELDALFDGFCSTAARRWWWQKEGMKFTVSRMRLKTKWKISTQDINSRFNFNSSLEWSYQPSDCNLSFMVIAGKEKKKGRREKNVLKTFFTIAQRKSIKAMMKINGILHIILCWVRVCHLWKSSIEFFSSSFAWTLSIFPRERCGLRSSFSTRIYFLCSFHSSDLNNFDI